MNPSISLKSEALPVVSLKLDNSDYTLSLPFTSVIEAEKSTGKSLKTLFEWWNVETHYLPALVRASLIQFHADVADEVTNKIFSCITTEGLSEIHAALCKMNFPKAMAQLEELHGKQSPVSQENTSPNE